MAEQVVSWALAGAGLYLAIGAAFAVAFVTRGVQRIDPDAAGGTWGFRVLIFPGAVALWPLLAKRWKGGGPVPPEERNAHRLAAGPAAHVEGSGGAR